MTQKIKLSEKQLAAITAVQNQKTQLNAMFQELNQKEALILELILEMKEIKGEVSGVKLEGDELIFDLKTDNIKTPAPKKVKVKEKPVKEDK